MAVDTLCRDCSHRYDHQASPSACPACGGSRTLRHPELMALSIAHIDCDAFYASIEKRDRPELADKPVIIGGGRRGVVATACYVARLYGVKSAMPMFKALRACPDAIVIKPDMAKYVSIGRDIRERMRALTPLVEPLSIDEAFLDLTGTERLHGAPPAVTLQRLQRQIADALNLTVSIGLSYNKFLAKTASDLDKPNGFFVIGKEEAKAFLAERSVRAIFGVGPAFAKSLEAKGYRTLRDLQVAEPSALKRHFGAQGLRLKHLALGHDTRSVDPLGERKSVSSETTFETDLRDLNVLEDILWRLSEKVSSRAKQAGIEGRVVTLKLKTARFKTVTRRLTLDAPTQLARVIFDAGRSLLQRERDRGPYRLLGIGVSDLAPAGPDRGALLDPNALKQAKAERAADALRAKIGDGAVKRGRDLRAEKNAEAIARQTDADDNRGDR